MSALLKALFTKYISHLSGYVGHALAILSLIPVQQLDPRLRLAIAVVGIITTSADHGYKAGSDALRAGIAAAVANVQNTIATAKPAALAFMCALLLGGGMAGLSGCSQVSAFLASPTGATVVTTSVDVAVATAESKGVQAAQINAIAKQALAADQGAAASLTAVAALVNKEIAALKLPPGDQAAADILVAALTAAIEAKVGDNATLAQAQAAVADVLQAVITATGG